MLLPTFNATPSTDQHAGVIPGTLPLAPPLTGLAAPSATTTAAGVMVLLSILREQEIEKRWIRGRLSACTCAWQGRARLEIRAVGVHATCDTMASPY